MVADVIYGSFPSQLRALSNDLQTMLRELAPPLACVRRLDKRAEKAPPFSYTFILLQLLVDPVQGGTACVREANCGIKSSNAKGVCRV